MKEYTKQLLCWIAAGVAVAFLYSIGMSALASAQAQMRIYPNEDTDIGGWDEKSSSLPNWRILAREPGEISDGDWVCGKRNAAATARYRVGVLKGAAGGSYSPVNVQQGATHLYAAMQGRVSYRFGGGNATVGLSIWVNNVQVGSNSGSWGNAPGTGFNNSCPGTFNTGAANHQGVSVSNVSPPAGQDSWSQAEINTLEFRTTRDSTDRAVRLNALAGFIYYVPYSNLSQSAYRIYQNTNSQVPGAALASNSNRASIDVGSAATEHPFRVRMNVRTQQHLWLQSYGTYKLQYIEKPVGVSCSNLSGWADITANTGKVRWHTNSGVANGTQLTNANAAQDPTTSSGGANTYQRYYSANPITKSSQVATNDSGLWDFSLKLSSAGADESFCLRIVPNGSNTQPLTGYPEYPEIVTMDSGILGMFVFDPGSDDGILPDPKLHFPSQLTQMQCVQSRATMSHMDDWVIGIYDSRWNGGNWTLHMAPTGGAGARWTPDSPLNTGSYAFNNPAGSPPGCTSGQLRTDMAQASLYDDDEGTCSPNGISFGANAAFSGSTPVTLVTASNADKDCISLPQNIHLEQSIPGGTPVGDYSLDMTLTLMSS